MEKDQRIPIVWTLLDSDKQNSAIIYILYIFGIYQSFINARMFTIH